MTKLHTIVGNKIISGDMEANHAQNHTATQCIHHNNEIKRITFQKKSVCKFLRPKHFHGGHDKIGSNFSAFEEILFLKGDYSLVLALNLLVYGFSASLGS